jgi:large subunit ribosomal protein L24
MAFRIKKNDTVLVTAGKDKGVTGKVLFVIPADGKAIVERVNFIKRHKRSKNPRAEPGGIIEKEAPISLSSLMLVCPKCSKPTRIGTRREESGIRVRVCKKCGAPV